MAEGVPEESKDGAKDLERDMPSTFGDLSMRMSVNVWGKKRGGAAAKKVHTPSTMPTGNMTPKASIITKIWAHSVESMGSGEMVAPSGMPWGSCSWASAMGSRRRRIAAVVVNVVLDDVEEKKEESGWCGRAGPRWGADREVGMAESGDNGVGVFRMRVRYSGRLCQWDERGRIIARTPVWVVSVCQCVSVSRTVWRYQQRRIGKCLLSFLKW